MKKYAEAFVLICLLFFAGPGTEALAQAKPITGSVGYSEAEGTSYARAVFAHYLAVIPNSQNPEYSVNCALSISNVCAVPEGSGLDVYIGDSFTETSTGGGFVIYLFHQDGTVDRFSSREHNYLGANLIGSGLGADGILEPGETFIVNLQEVLAAVNGVNVQDVEPFVGYGWVLSEFGCLAGTYSTTIYGYGFTQAFEFKPAMGQGNQFGGLMLPSN